MKKGWPTKTLAEVCQIKPPKSEARETVSASSLVSFLPMEDMGIDVKLVQATQTKPLSAVVGSYTYFADGDVLLAKITPCFENGKLGIADGLKNGIGFGSSEYFVFRPDPTVSKEWLYYFLSRDTFRVEGAARMSGAVGHKRVSKEFIEDYPIPVPPLAEQQRIVVLLDEAFEGLATAKANAEKNLQNARALFESHLQSVFTQRGPGWVEKTFEELIESNIIGLTKNSREQGEDKAWPYVKMNNITRDNRFDFSRFTCVDATAEEVSKFSLKDGDFLFNTRNSHELVGKSCIYESDSNDAVLYNNNIMRVRFQRGIDARFVLLAFSSKGVADELNALKSGTTNVSAIYFKDLKSLVIPVPPIAEQKRTAAKLESLVAETQRLARLYERKHAALEALKKSLLHQAFTGEL